MGGRGGEGNLGGERVKDGEGCEGGCVGSKGSTSEVGGTNEGGRGMKEDQAPLSLIFSQPLYLNLTMPLSHLSSLFHRQVRMLWHGC